MKIRDQLAAALLEAMGEERRTQTALAADMGITLKHLNRMLNGHVGAYALWDFAAFALGRRWVVTLELAESEESA